MRDQLIERINSFAYWHYPFDLGDGIVIQAPQGSEKLQLRDFIWPKVLELWGGSLKGVRVLDVGCNAGFWSLEAYKSGADYTLGVDARQEHIEQAQLVRQALEIDPGRLEYMRMSVYDLSPERVGKFDLCLILRVLHHLGNPLLALQRLREVSRGYVVIEIKMVLMEEPVLYLIEEEPSGGLLGVEGLALRPSLSALEMMISYSGFEELERLLPGSDLEDRYRYGRRVVFTARVPLRGYRTGVPP